MGLRPYQNDCLESISRNHSEGCNSQLIILPTGTGKTVLFAQAPKWNPGKRTLILAHTEELVGQAVEKVQHWNPTLRVGVEMATASCLHSDDVVIGSVPTLGRAGSTRLLALNPDDFGAVVIDEAHHAVASTYRRIMGHFGFGLGRDAPKSRLLLGVTATAARGDGQGLHEIFEKVVYQYSMLQAIKDGWICPPKGYRVTTQTDIDDVHTLAGDFQKEELSNAVNTEGRNNIIVDRWLEVGENRPTLAFTVDIAHAKDLAAVFQRKGVRADAIWGDDPERAEKLRRHRNGEITVLTNCGVLIEGYDDCTIGCIILARPTKSKLLFIQMIGRGLRLQDGTGNLIEALAQGLSLLKLDCIILDFIDNTKKHSLITLPSLFGLPRRLQLNGQNLLKAVEEMEELERENPQIDFDNLEDMDGALSYVEHINLFTEDIDPVIAELSQWRWMLTAKGTYALYLPRHDSVILSQNLLGHWEAHGKVSGVEFEDSSQELGDAVCTAERLIKQFWKGSKVSLRRASKMPGEDLPASAQQLQKIRNIYTSLGETAPDISHANYYQATLLLNKLVERIPMQ